MFKWMLIHIFYYWSGVCWLGLLILCIIRKRRKLAFILVLGLAVELCLANSLIAQTILGLDQWIPFLFSVVAMGMIVFRLIQHRKFKRLVLFLISFLLFAFSLLYFLRGLSGRLISFPQKLPMLDVRLVKSVSYRAACLEKFFGSIEQGKTSVYKALKDLNFEYEWCHGEECSFRQPIDDVGIRVNFYQLEGENGIRFEIVSENAAKLRQYKKDGCLQGKLKDQLMTISKTSQVEEATFQCIPYFESNY